LPPAAATRARARRALPGQGGRDPRPAGGGAVKRPDPLVVAVGVLGLVLFLGAWKLYVVHWDVSRFVLPPPEDVAGATWDLATRATTWEHVRTTATEIVAGFALATLAGVVLGAFLAELPLLDRALTPHVVA